MHCQEAGRQLNLYLDERLTLEQMRNLEAHVARCAACREKLAVLEEVSHQLKLIQTFAEPEDMHAQRYMSEAIKIQLVVRQPGVFSQRIHSLRMRSLSLTLVFIWLLASTALPTIAFYFTKNPYILS